MQLLDNEMTGGDFKKILIKESEDKGIGFAYKILDYYCDNTAFVGPLSPPPITLCVAIGLPLILVATNIWSHIYYSLVPPSTIVLVGESGNKIFNVFDLRKIAFLVLTY